MQLHQGKDKITGAGANLYVIGNGSPSFIEGFREQTKYMGPIYTDPSLEVFKAAGLKRSVTATIDPRGVLKGVGSFMRGHRQGGTKGDPWQQGGVLVVGTGGEITFQHASDRPGDNASVEQIVRSL